MTFSEVIDRWPSMTAFAKDIGVPYRRVRSWRQRSSIRATYFQAIVDAAASRGYTDITAAVLLDAAARRGMVTDDHSLRMQHAA